MARRSPATARARAPTPAPIRVSETLGDGAACLRWTGVPAPATRLPPTTARVIALWRVQDLHDHQQRPSRDADGDQGVDQRQRWDLGRPRTSRAGHGAGDRQDAPTRSATAYSVSVDAGAYSVQVSPRPWRRPLGLIGRRVAEGGQDLHDHEQLCSSQADASGDKHVIPTCSTKVRR